MPGTDQEQVPHPFPRTALLGFGAFGRLAATHLAGHTDLAVIDPTASEADVRASGARPGTIEADVPQADLVILAVPVQAIETACRAIASHLRTSSDRPPLVVDVASVKMKPAEWMSALLPERCQILATHPCFGPETARELGTIASQPIACCPVRIDDETLAAVRTFLTTTLGLSVIDLTPDEHDEQMALVQVITHLIGHAAHHMSLPELPTATLAYRYLLQMQHNTERDAPRLFEAIQHLNPHAAKARERFRQAIDAVLAKAEPTQ
ncbi:MAG: prephenate dehydrogenase [Phycisphaerales bacterium]|jgi:prephenate dehydrogenase